MGCWEFPPGSRRMEPLGKTLRDQSHTSQEAGDEQIKFSLGCCTSGVAGDSWPRTGSLEVSEESVNKIPAGWMLWSCIRIWNIPN